MLIKSRYYNIKRLVLLISIIVILIFSTSIISTQNGYSDGDINYKNGMNCLETGDYKKAEKYFEASYNAYKKDKQVLLTSRALNKWGDALFGLSKYSTAFEKKLKALEVFSLLKERSDIKNTLFELSEKTYYIALDSNLPDKNWLPSIRQHLSNVRDTLDSFQGIYSYTMGLFIIAYNLSVIGYDKMALEVYEKGIYIESEWKYSKEDEPFRRANIQTIINMMLNRGAIYEKNKDYKLAAGYYQKVIDLCFIYDVYNILLEALDGLDTIYRKVGNKENAENYYNYVIKQLIKQNNNYTTSNIMFFFAKKRMNENLSSYNDTINLYEKALFTLGFNDYKNFKGLNNANKKLLAMQILIEMASINNDNEKSKEAISQLDLALKIYELFKLEKDSFNINDTIKIILFNKAKAYTKLNNIEEAEKNYLKAITLSEKKEDFYELADYFIRLARFEATYNYKYSLAIGLYEKAMTYNQLGIEKQNKSNLFYEQRIVITYEKAMMLYKIKEYSKAIKELEKIKNELIAERKFSTNSKNNQIKYKLSSYKMLSYLLRKKKDGEASFDYTEYARLYAFYEYVYRNNFFDGMKLGEKENSSPKDIYKILDNIANVIYDKLNIMKYEPEKINSIAVESAYGKNHYTFNQSINDSYIKYKNITDKLVEKYQPVKNLFGNKITSAKNIREQQFLQKDTGIIVYSMNYNNFSKPILFLIADNKVKKYTELKRLDYTNLVKEYLEKLSDKKNNDYIELSKKLYKYLIKPIEKDITNLKHLIIVPDGAFNYLPFETLISEDKFLVENYKISYSTSVSSYRELIRKGKIKKKSIDEKFPFLLIGNNVYDNDIIKKQYEQSSSRLDDYMNNFSLQINSLKNENIENFLKDMGFETKPSIKLDNSLKNIATIFYDSSSKDYNNSILIGNNASEELLRYKNSYKELKKYSIVQISSQIINIEPLSTILLFQDTDKKNIEKDGYFHFRDINLLTLDARLIILDQILNIFSKDSTITGEGLTNMLNSVINSGIDNVLISLWQGDNKINSQFIESLYKQIKDSNLNYSNIIQQIKIDFISKQDYKHPYYWANLVIYGAD